MKIYRPLWNEGALLSPQQFQQQSEWESFRSTGVAALASPFAWGVERAEFDERLLGSGLLQITRLRLWLPDGTLVDTGTSDLPPEPRELELSQRSDVVTVMLALPLTPLMRKSALVSLIFHVLAVVAALVWLLWGFIPAGTLFKGMMTAGIAALTVWWVRRKNRSSQIKAEGETSVGELQLFDAGGPVVLVCGDELDALFLGQTLRKTAQGWWLRVNDVNRLSEMVRDIHEQQPRQTGQLAVMYVCQPDRHQDEAVLRASLKTLRQQMKQLSQIAGFSLPLMLSGEFSGPSTPWLVVRGDKTVVPDYKMYRRYASGS